MAIVVDGGGLRCCLLQTFVTMRSRRPGGESGVKEERMFKPGVFKAKNGGFGDVGGGCDEEGDMIRSGTGTGGESDVGEHGADGVVEESTVQPGKSWRFSHVTPSELPVEKGEFE